MSDKKKPYGISLGEKMEIDQCSSETPKIGTMQGKIATLWCVSEGSNDIADHSHPSIEKIIKCLEWAKETLGKKYFNIHLRINLSEESRYDVERFELYVLGERPETENEFKKRENQYWLKRKQDLEQYEIKEKHWQSERGKEEKEKIMKLFILKTTTKT